MSRTITAFFLDEAGHWAARLSCGHGHHMRHVPPLASRPWVLDEAGRAARIGLAVDCLKCDRGEPPDAPEPAR